MDEGADENMDPRRPSTKEEIRTKQLEDEVERLQGVVQRLKDKLLETCDKCSDPYRVQCEDCPETMCNDCYSSRGDCCVRCLVILCDDCQIYECENCGNYCKGCAEPFCRLENGDTIFEHTNC